MAEEIMKWAELVCAISAGALMFGLAGLVFFLLGYLVVNAIRDERERRQTPKG